MYVQLKTSYFFGGKKISKKKDILLYHCIPLSTMTTPMPRTPTNTPRSTMNTSQKTIDTSPLRRDLNNMFITRGGRRSRTPLYITPEDTRRPMIIHKRVQHLRRQHTFRPQKSPGRNKGGKTLRVSLGKKLKRVKSSPRALFLLNRAHLQHKNRDKYVVVKKSSHGIKRDTPKVKPCGAAPSPNVELNVKSE